MSSIKKIVVIGPESTGKSTLSAALAEALHTCWVPEYARRYLLQLGRDYQQQDLARIARGQLDEEDILTQEANKYLICDTDLNVIKVWSEHKYGACDTTILQQIAMRQYDLYLLTDIDIPWEDDPLREHPTPDMRAYFLQVYKDIVMQSGTPWALISGTPQERVLRSLQIINELWSG